MASYGAILRPSALATTAAAERAKEGLRSTRRALTKLSSSSSSSLHPSFTLPPDLESAAVRAARNLVRFRIHYALVLWTALGASLCHGPGSTPLQIRSVRGGYILVPARQDALLLLVASSFPAAAYAVVLRAAPSSALLHPVVDRVLVAALFVVVNVVQLVKNKAIQHLLITVSAWFVVVLVHAVLRVEGAAAAAEEEEEEGEFVAFVGEKEEEGDLEIGS